MSASQGLQVDIIGPRSLDQTRTQRRRARRRDRNRQTATDLRRVQSCGVDVDAVAWVGAFPHDSSLTLFKLVEVVLRRLRRASTSAFRFFRLEKPQASFFAEDSIA
jgi:hypothetical protein